MYRLTIKKTMRFLFAIILQIIWLSIFKHGHYIIFNTKKHERQTKFIKYITLISLYYSRFANPLFKGDYWFDSINLFRGGT